MRSPIGKEVLKAFVAEVEYQRKILLDINKKIRELSKSEKYKRNIELLQSVPGIGIVYAITFLTQIENIHRFKNTEHLASYIGIIPNTHCSGEKDFTGKITSRGIHELKKNLN